MTPSDNINVFGIDELTAFKKRYKETPIIPSTLVKVGTAFFDDYSSPVVKVFMHPLDIIMVEYFNFPLMRLDYAMDWILEKTNYKFDLKIAQLLRGQTDARSD